MRLLKNIQIITFLAFVLISFSVSGQNVENVGFHVTDDNAFITYDLVGVKENQDIEVRLYCTLKGYDMLLYRATGDVGKEVSAGKNKSIVWNNDEELTAYDKNDMTFKVVVVTKQPYKSQKDSRKESKSNSKGIFSVFAGKF